MSLSTTPLEDLALEILAGRCALETERFLHKQAADNAYCFEILRRAITLQDQEAWACIYAQYRLLVASWVQSHAVITRYDEDVDFFVNGAFARVQRWCTPERFASFATLPQWLAALRSCVQSEIIDFQRRRDAPPALEVSEDTISELHAEVTSPEDNAIGAEMRLTFWRIVQKLLQNEQERLLVFYCFILGYRAREVCKLCQAHFHDIQEVYRVKENLLRRMRRDPSLRRFFEEYGGAFGE